MLASSALYLESAQPQEWGLLLTSALYLESAQQLV
jgi:hypothetical protein